MDVSFPLPTAASATREEIKKHASGVRAMVGHVTGGALRERLRSIGAMIFYGDGPMINGRPIRMIAFGERCFHIWLPDNAGTAANNLIIAKLLGHLAMHRKDAAGPLMVFADENKEQDDKYVAREVEAFALEFLTPAREFSERIRQFPHSLHVLAVTFGVPEIFAQRRLSDLNITAVAA